jgi:hypothetical protein
MQEKTSASTKEKPQRGRPKTSDLSPKEQVRLRVQKLRERKRQQKLVPVEIWIPEKLRDWLAQRGEDLSSFAKEALEAFAKERGY